MNGVLGGIGAVAGFLVGYRNGVYGAGIGAALGYLAGSVVALILQGVKRKWF
jgi:hypothetical protein